MRFWQAHYVQRAGLLVQQQHARITATDIKSPHSKTTDHMAYDVEMMLQHDIWPVQW
jgi:hypothetical protein